MAGEKQVRYDIEGYEAVTSALMDLLNQFPGLSDGEEFVFSNIPGKSGMAMYAVSGAVIETEKKSVTGIVAEVCLYPFSIAYKASGLSESRRVGKKEWLDTLGKWLEKKEVKINGESYRLEEYPPLTGDREFLQISRQTPAYLDSEEEDHAENWVIYLMGRYQNKYRPS